jgi:hypothetical protein
MIYIIYIDPPLGGFDEILPKVMIFPEGENDHNLMLVAKNAMH